MKIIALYKNEDYLKILLGEETKIYEVLLMKGNDYRDVVMINPNILTETRKITENELNNIIVVTLKVLRELVRSNNVLLRISTEIDFNTSLLEEIIKEYNYKGIEKAQPLYIEYLSNEKRVDALTKDKQDYSTNLEDFIREYEDKKLILKRFYRKQRTNRLNWDQYFMYIAKLSALRSKDPSTQVGACIVGKNHRILSIGYNGAPMGMDDDYFPWERKGMPLHTKYMYVCHAEMNAILNYKGSREDLEGATLYVDLFPCNECAKMIVQSGIKEVVYLSDKYKDTDSVIASKRILDAAGVTYRRINEECLNEITLSLKLDK